MANLSKVLHSAEIYTGRGKKTQQLCAVNTCTKIQGLNIHAL